MQLNTLRIDNAIAALGLTLAFREPADACLGRYFRDRPKLGAQDRAFIAETVFAVLRRKRFLETVAEDASPRRLILAALARLQGLGLNELEPFLRKDESDWLKAMKARSMDDKTLAVRADLPDWLAGRLQHSMDEDGILALARAMQQPAPLDLRINTLLAEREEILAAFRAEGIEAAPAPYSPVGIRLKEKIALNRHPLFLAGKVEVQDEGSQLLGYLVAPRRQEMVVDFCAGAGGKSLHLGALMQSQGRLYAFDVAEKRLANLKPRLKRSGLSNLHPQLIGSENDPKVKRLRGKIDRVLVDAPCSGLGTLRRNPDLKWRQTPESVTELVQKQTAILAAASQLLKSGGRLVYATCSILPEENEAIVEAFLETHPEFALGDSTAVLAGQHIPLDTGKYLKLNPAIHGTDGFFAAILERQAD